MGVSGLLPLLKSIQRPTELKKFAGETLGVDGYGWLHRGAIACAVELALGKPTRKYVDYAMHRVRMLKHFGVTPYMVFDGDFLPSKAATEAHREKRREDSKKIGMEFLKAGKQAQAYAELQKAIDVTPEMARNLIEELKIAGIKYVVAPYEADAQLVYLERQGLISGIISEDSDILVFGAKKLLTKLGPHGECVEINRRDFCAVREVCLTGWTDTEFRHMAIFSGCDYLAGVNKVGLKTAHRMIRKHKTPERVIRMLQFDGKCQISENYLAAFKQAELTFMYQRVFCPKKQELVLLTEPDTLVDVENMPFIGGRVEKHMAQAIAAGDVNPITKLPIVLSRPEKRRNSQSASVATAVAQKKPLGKPINSYFKAYGRVPLGEMDPNCFAVDPAEVAHLTENGLLPRVFPLPRPYIQGEEGSTASGATRRSSASRTLRRHTEPIATLLGMDNPTISRPSKKARLCDAASDDVPEVTLERSKFFPPHSKKRHSTNSDSFLKSDDSVEEALLSLPDFDLWPETQSRRSSAKISVYEESPKMADKKVSTFSLDRDSHTSDVSQQNIDVSISSPLPKLSSQTEQTTSQTLTVAVHKFMYTPGSGSSSGSQKRSIFTNRTVHGLPTPASSTQSTYETDETRGKSPSLSQTSMRTPLQRLGARALHGPTRTPPATPLTRDVEKQPRLEFSVKAPHPSMVPLPKVDLSEVEALNKSMGSEDQIIPDSDEEDEADSWGNGTSPASDQGRLDLSRFMFA